MALENSLQLGEIILENYRTYKGTTTIELSRDQDKTITIIEGEMGKGKTTILNAVYWCLYGKFKSSGNPSDENIINNDVLSSLKLDDENDTSVEIKLYEDDELCYNIKRNVHFIKKQESSRLVFRDDIDGSIPEGIEIASTIEFRHLPKLSDSDWKVYTDPVQARDAILNIFPESLSSYFLFDGELLDNFFDVGHENNVKNGIERISGLPILDDSITHIKKTHDDVLNDIKSPNTESLKNQIFHFEQSIESWEKTIEETDQKLRIINTEMDGIQSYLRNNDEKSVRLQQARVDDFNTRISKLRAELKKLDNDMGEWLLYCNTVFRLRDTMKSSLEKCNEWEKDGKIPIAVSGQALNNILHAKPSICICGTHLEENSKERVYMEELLKKNTADSPIIQSIAVGRGHWDDMVAETNPDSLVEKLNDYRSKRAELNSQYEQNSIHLKEISKELKKHDREQIRTKSHRLHELKNEDRNLTGERAIAAEKIKSATIEHEQLVRKFDSETQKEDKFKSYYNRRELARVIENILQQCRDELIEELRSTVANKTTEYFLRLVSRNDFSKVEIEPNYAVSTYGPAGRSKSLSAGQTCCLALSYIAAIRDIAEKNYFMMIDSPLHNIDQGERVHIAENLPQFIPGTQITLLVQDQEYVGSINKTETRDAITSVRNTLKNNNSLWKEYKLGISENPETKSYNTIITEMKN